MQQPGPGLTDHYRLWYVRRGDDVQGPFPEPLICRYMALGRVADTDEVSQDGSYWRGAENVAELVRGMQALLSPTEGAVNQDEAWAEERSRAARRWLDDRKSPDPRGRSDVPVPPDIQERRSGRDRRLLPETVEQKTYREGRGDFEVWLRSRRQRYGIAAAFVVLALLWLAISPTLFKPVNPVAVGLHIGASNCAAVARKGVNWSGCAMDGALLVGADLRAADLLGASLKQANLRYADLTRANLLRADLRGADLTGTRLDGAVWSDGRVCAAGSVGVCK